MARMVQILSSAHMGILSIAIFQSSLVLILPLCFAAILVITLIASLQVEGAKAENSARAIACHLLQTLGVFMMAMSGVQMVYSLLTLRFPSSDNAASLVLLFVVGLGILIHQSRILHGIDHASRLVPGLIFWYVCVLMGNLIALIAAISIGISTLINHEPSGWQMPSTLIILGLTMAFLASKHTFERTQSKKRK